MNELVNERMTLAEKRIQEIANQYADKKENAIDRYFCEIFSFASLLCDIWHKLDDVVADTLSIQDLTDINISLYEGITSSKYVNSYANPTVSTRDFGTEMGRLLSAYMAELRAAIPSLYERDMASLVMRLELVLELFSAYTGSVEAEEDMNASDIRSILYFYYRDYLQEETDRKVKAQVLPEDNFIKNLLVSEAEADSDIRALLLIGEYISENELKMYRFLSSLPEETVCSMAKTYTDGYIKGFEVTGRDLSIKKTAEIRFNLGFLPMMRYARRQLKEAGLDCTCIRAGYSLFTGRTVDKNGVFGGNAGPQYDFDHKSDMALILDRDLMEYRLECLKNAYESVNEAAHLYAGPAVVEIFGEPDFEPEIKKEAADYTEENRPLVTEYASHAGSIVNDYIPGEERSFTIIAYPVPSIGSDFEEIFSETIKINTLDYTLYRDIQQTIIVTLDQAEYVYVKGMGDNKTDMHIRLHDITDPEKETKFENCVADVNIPVGEVFTSPVLKGTNGKLHVTKVFLNGLEYHDLDIDIKDGMISAYNCKEGKKLIEDNILFHHESLPMGECAIGTNTTAYVVARKYNIEAQMPILIAEKCGPHFAFGDTCYSHCEDLAVYNPDGKEIVARDNECSILRKTSPEKAYFNCHTDITIPYDELGEVSAICADGSVINIILNGKFVLPGCEELNRPLEEAK